MRAKRKRGSGTDSGSGDGIESMFKRGLKRMNRAAQGVDKSARAHASKAAAGSDLTWNQ